MRRRRVWAGLLLGGLLLGAGAAATWYGLLGGGEPFQRTAIDGLAPRESAVDDAARGDDEDEREGEGEGESEAEEALPGVVNVLVAGSDSRDGLTEQEIEDLSLGSFDGARPDTIILAQVRPDGSDAVLLSIPRDLRVDHCDGSVDKINHAFALAGSVGKEGGSCLVETVTDTTGIPVHHYVEVDVPGFMQVVDTIGGVEMCLDSAKRDARAGLDLPAGCQRLDGADSLAYVRTRSIDGAGDFGRMDRQQRFVRALADEASDASFFANVPRLVRTLEKLEQAVTTDDGLGLRTMRTLASALSDADGDDINGTTVPGEGRTIDGTYYLEMAEDEAERLFAAFREGRAHEELSKTATSRADE